MTLVTPISRHNRFLSTCFISSLFPVQQLLLLGFLRGDWLISEAQLCLDYWLQGLMDRTAGLRVFRGAINASTYWSSLTLMCCWAFSRLKIVLKSKSYTQRMSWTHQKKWLEHKNNQIWNKGFSFNIQAKLRCSEAAVLPLRNVCCMCQRLNDHIVFRTNTVAAEPKSHPLLNTSCAGSTWLLQLSGSLSQQFTMTTRLPTTTRWPDRRNIELPIIP